MFQGNDGAPGAVGEPGLPGPKVRSQDTHNMYNTEKYAPALLSFFLINLKGTDCWCNLEKFSLDIQSSLFVIRLNLRHL